MFDYFDPEQVLGWLMITMGAAVGRIMFHIKEVRRGMRTFFSFELLMELPIALGMGFIASGIGEYLNMHGNAQLGLVIIVSYLGPRWIDYIADLIATKKFGLGKDSTEIEEEL